MPTQLSIQKPLTRSLPVKRGPSSEASIQTIVPEKPISPKPPAEADSIILHHHADIDPSAHNHITDDPHGADIEVRYEHWVAEDARVLGEGGTARVSQAAEPELGLVLRELNPEVAAANPDFPVNERSVANDIMHNPIPDTPTIHDVHPDGMCTLQDEIRGVELKEVIENHGPLPLRTALEITRRVAKALSIMHERGYVHRDVKPGNIMVEFKNGKLESVTLIDILMAQRLDPGGSAITLKGVIGTPGYMAPEQMLQVVTKQTDSYALGKVLWEMLSGKRFPASGEKPCIGA